MSISSPPNYGSPDWQRGYYSAQKLLASGASPITVTLPPNCETLCIAFRTQTINTITVTGSQSGLGYGVVGAPGGNGGAPLHIASKFYYVDVSEALDTQVTVTVTDVIVGNCLVYADAGVHIVVDSSKLTNLIAEQYVVPTVPSVLAGDHPPNELRQYSGTFSANGTLLAAPGVGLRYRIFGAMIGTQGAAVVGYLQSNVLGQFCIGGPSAPGASSFYPTGLPCGNNDTVDYAQWSGSGNMLAMVTYTIETI